MTEYLEIKLYNNLFQTICSRWNIHDSEFSHVLKESGGLLMGSTAVACIINEAINDDIDVFVDTEKGWYILNNYLLKNNYFIMRKSKLSEYSGMVARIDKPFELIVFTYKSIWGGSPVKTFQIILCTNLSLARDNVDIGITQCAYDGVSWTIPADYLEYIGSKVTWVLPDMEDLSRYEREVRIQKYKNRDFQFIDKPDDLVDVMMAVQL